MLVKFLNSDSTVSTAIAGSYFKGDGWTGAYYDSGTGQLVFESEDGLGFTTGDLRVATGGTSSVEWASVLNKPTEFTPVSHNHEISDVTGLQAALTAATDTLTTLQAEITEARSQLAAVATFASPNAGGIVPGRYYDNATGSTNSNLYTGAANRVDMVTFITSVPLTVDRIGFAIATPGSSAYGRAFIYSSGADGWPESLMYESNSDLDLNSGTFQGETLASPFTFEANRIYWVGWRFGAATTYATMRGVSATSVPNMGLLASNGNTYCSVLRRNIPFETPMPVTWVFDQSELAANIIAPSFRMRAA